MRLLNVKCKEIESNGKKNQEVDIVGKTAPVVAEDYPLTISGILNTDLFAIKSFYNSNNGKSTVFWFFV